MWPFRKSPQRASYSWVIDRMKVGEEWCISMPAPEGRLRSTTFRILEIGYYPTNGGVAAYSHGVRALVDGKEVLMGAGELQCSYLNIEPLIT